MPKRIQMSRQHPWRAENPDAVRVDRNTKYGNPFKVVLLARGDGYAIEIPDGRQFGHFWSKREATEHAVKRFRTETAPGLDLTPLRGHDIACWCGLDQPCHGDVILELSNGRPADV